MLSQKTITFYRGGGNFSLCIRCLGLSCETGVFQKKNHINTKSPIFQKTKEQGFWMVIFEFIALVFVLMTNLLKELAK
jgi:hypothetical protein